MSQRCINYPDVTGKRKVLDRTGDSHVACIFLILRLSAAGCTMKGDVKWCHELFRGFIPSKFGEGGGDNSVEGM